MASEAGNKLTTWRSKAVKACPQRKAAIEALTQLLKECFRSPQRRPDMEKVVKCLKGILDDIKRLCEK